MIRTSARSRTWSASLIGALLSGVHQFAVRWYTVSDATESAIIGTTWTPLDEVPMTATRLPARSIGWSGHCPVCTDTPVNWSRPGTSGRYGMDKTPVAAMTKRARTTVPSLACTVHPPDWSSKSADVMRAPTRI